MFPNYDETGREYRPLRVSETPHGKVCTLSRFYLDIEDQETQNKWAKCLETPTDFPLDSLFLVTHYLRLSVNQFLTYYDVHVYVTSTDMKKREGGGIRVPGRIYLLEETDGGIRTFSIRKAGMNVDLPFVIDPSL